MHQIYFKDPDGYWIELNDAVRDNSLLYRKAIAAAIDSTRDAETNATSISRITGPKRELSVG